jgi:hypothetical protein
VNIGSGEDVVAQALVVYTAGKLSVLTAVDLPDGWVGCAVLVPSLDGRNPGDLPGIPALSGYAGTIDLPVSLSEAHDAVLRGEGEPDDRSAQAPP